MDYLIYDPHTPPFFSHQIGVSYEHNMDMIYYDRVWMGWKLPILCSKIGVSENSGFTHYVFCLTWNMIFQSRVSVHIMLLDNPENYHWR